MTHDAEYPEICRAAREAGATIFFGDEAAVRSDYHSGTTWAPRGKTPVVPSTGARFSLNLVSAVSARGQMRFMTVEGRLNASKFIGFLKRLLVSAKRPIFLIVDHHPVHRSAAVRKFVDSTEGRLRLFFLPSYSPELNPDEQVWNHVKNHGVGRMTPAGPDQLKRAALQRLRSLQKLAGTIQGFFSAPGNPLYSAIECRVVSDRLSSSQAGPAS